MNNDLWAIFRTSSERARREAEQVHSGRTLPIDRKAKAEAMGMVPVDVIDIEAARVKSGLTWPQVAARMNMNTSTLTSRIQYAKRNGRIQPTFLDKFWHALNMK